MSKKPLLLILISTLIIAVIGLFFIIQREPTESPTIQETEISEESVQEDTDENEIPSQFGYYAKNADIRIVNDAPWEKNDPNQPDKWPAHPPEGSIIIQFNNYIPGLGSSGISADYNKDGYAENNSVFLGTTLS